MAELIVVATIIVITLTSLYISYNKLVVSYKEIINYYDVGLKYRLGYFQQYVTSNDNYTELKEKTEDKKIIHLNEDAMVKDQIDDSVNEDIYIVRKYDNLSDLKTEVNNQTFKDYIEFLENTIDKDIEYFMVGEKCFDTTDGTDQCKYAYLELAEYSEIKREPISLLSQTLDDGVVGTSYSDEFNGATEGTGNYTYKIKEVYLDGELVEISGDNYNGLKLSDTTITGKPTVKGKYDFKIEAEDSTTHVTTEGTITVNVLGIFNDFTTLIKMNTTSPLVGSNLNLELSNVVPTPETHIYTWYVNDTNSKSGGTKIGTNNNSLTLTDEMYKKYIYAEVTVKKAGYIDKTVISSNIIGPIEKLGFADQTFDVNYKDSMIAIQHNEAINVTNNHTYTKVTSSGVCSNVEYDGTNRKISFTSNNIGECNVVVKVADNITKVTEEATMKINVKLSNLSQIGVNITGNTLVGQTLTANPICSGTCPSEDGYSYEWYIVDKKTNTGGEKKGTGKTLKLTSDMRGKYAYVKLTAKKIGYNTQTVNSSPSNQILETYTYTYTFKPNNAVLISNGQQYTIDVSLICKVDSPNARGVDECDNGITVPTITRDGYAAIGFNKSASATTSTLEMGKSIKIKEDVTYYAITSPNIYKVTLDNQGATSAGTTEVYYQYNTTKTVNGTLCYYYTDSSLTNCLSGGYKIVNPTKTGYTFGGYYTKQTGNGTQYVNSGGTFVNNVYQTMGNKTLYASWSDTTPPAIPIYCASHFTSISNTNCNYTSGTWTNSAVYTKITSSDAGSGVSNIQYSSNKTDWTNLNFATSNGLQKNGINVTGVESWTVRNGRNDTYYFRACDAEDNCSEPSIAYNIKYDTEAPTSVNITSTNNLTASQTATISCKDNIGVTSYYFGTNASPTVDDYIAITSTKEFETAKIVNTAGTYNLYCKDVAGNVSTKASKDFYKTVFIMTNGTVGLTNVLTMSGNSFVLPTPTISKGYVAKGEWYAENTYTTSKGVYGALYKPIVNATLYSTAVVKTYTISYNANGGSGTAPESHVATYGTTVTIKDNTFTRKGYTFNGWTSNSNGTDDKANWTNWSGIWTYDNNELGIVNNKLVLYAMWTPKKYTISYNANGGTGTAPESHEAEFGKTVTIKANTFSKIGYSFAGWTSNANGTPDKSGWTNWSGTWSWDNGEYGISNNKLVLYAMWTPEKYTITYNSNGGTGTMESSEATYGEGFLTRENTFTRKGYTFAGWNEKADGTGTNWGLEGTGVFESSKPWTWTYTKDITLYAKWTPKSFKISYKANGGSGTAPESHTVIYGNNVAIKANTFNYSGHTFIGWTTNSNGVNDGHKWTNWSGTWAYDNNEYGIKNNELVLYAMWGSKSYTISYNANGGTGTPPESQTVSYGSNVTIKANTFTKVGYTFDGWTSNANGTDDGAGWTNWSGIWKWDNGVYGIINDKLILYARWKPNEYNVEYSGNVFTMPINHDANGIKVSYDDSTSYLTLNGSMLGKMSAFSYVPISLKTGDKYKMTIETISGNVSSSTGLCFEEIDSDKQYLSSRNYGCSVLSSTKGVTQTATLTVKNTRNAYFMVYPLYENASTTAKANFTDLKIKITITKIDTKIVTYGNTYGTLGTTPVRNGYTFDGWIKEDNNETSDESYFISSSTIVNTPKDHTLYAKWTKNDTSTATFIADVMSLKSPVTEDGVTFFYNDTNRYLTINGTSTDSSMSFNHDYRTLVQGDKYELDTEYLGGTPPDSSIYTSFGINSRKDGMGSLSVTNSISFKRPYIDWFSTPKILTINSAAEKEGKQIAHNVSSSTGAVFNNYKVKLRIAKINTKSVTNGNAYGTLPTAPIKDGYVFNGWYTKEFCQGTEITSSMVVQTKYDHNIYACWKSVEPIEFNDQILANAIVGIDYSQTFKAASKGSGDFRYELNSVKKDGRDITGTNDEYDGLSLNTSTRVISGIPASRGTYVFNVTVIDNKTTKKMTAEISVPVGQKYTHTYTFKPNNATLIHNGTNYLEDVKLSCTSDWTQESNGSCEIVTPSIIRTNYRAIGFNENIDALTATLNVKTEYEINSNRTFYAITEMIDNEAPVITFNPDGNSEWAKEYSSVVKVTDESEITEMKYVWVTSNVGADASNKNSISNDKITSGSENGLYTKTATLNKSDGTGNYYLCVYAKDKYNNSGTTCSKAFAFDNTKPTISVSEQICVNANDSIEFKKLATITDKESGTSVDKVVAKSNGIVVNNLKDIIDKVDNKGTVTITFSVSDEVGNVSDEVNTKINIYAKPENIEEIVTSGDGLYLDGLTNNRYIYRGEDPNNYITFNGEEGKWRILSIEADGTYKIIYTGTDKLYAFNSTNSNLFPFNGTSLYTTLNTTLYNSLSAEVRNQIVTHPFYYGNITYNIRTSSDTLATVYNTNNASDRIENLNVGIPTIFDLIQASSETRCNNPSTEIQDTVLGGCAANNWMAGLTSSGTYMWVFHQYSNSQIWHCSVSSCTYANRYSNSATRTQPVVYLSASTTFTGTGTKTDPYVINTSCSSTSSTTCTISALDGYQPSQTLTINSANNEGVTYSWDGTNFGTSNTKENVTTAGSYMAYIKDVNGQTNRCSITLKSRNEYHTRTCNTWSNWSGFNTAYSSSTCSSYTTNSYKQQCINVMRVYANCNNTGYKQNTYNYSLDNPGGSCSGACQTLQNNCETSPGGSTFDCYCKYGYEYATRSCSIWNDWGEWTTIKPSYSEENDYWGQRITYGIS